VNPRRMFSFMTNLPSISNRTITSDQMIHALRTIRRRLRTSCQAHLDWTGRLQAAHQVPKVTRSPNATEPARRRQLNSIPGGGSILRLEDRQRPSVKNAGPETWKSRNVRPAILETSDAFRPALIDTTSSRPAHGVFSTLPPRTFLRPSFIAGPRAPFMVSVNLSILSFCSGVVVGAVA
jgi:hypothetical protein